MAIVSNGNMESQSTIRNESKKFVDSLLNPKPVEVIKPLSTEESGAYKPCVFGRHSGNFNTPLKTWKRL